MPTKQRIQLQNVSNHVYSRCHNLENKLAEDVFKEIVLESVTRAMGLYKFEVSAISILDNHIHVIIKTLPGEAKISRIMQYIKARITEKFNKMTGSKGTLWNERYGSKIVELSEDPVIYLNRLLWYLAYNPVRKGNVKDPRDYKYSTILAYLDESYKPRIKITLNEYYLMLGKNFQERLNIFLLFEQSYNSQMCA